MITINIDDINKGTRVVLIGKDVSFSLDNETILIDIDGLTGTVIEKITGIFVTYIILMDEHCRSAHYKLKNSSLKWTVCQTMVDKL